MPRSDIPALSIVRNQTAAYTASSAAISNAVGDGVSVVRLVATSACHIKVAVTPVATSSDMLLPANTVQYIAIAPGQKVAAIQNSAGGTLHVTEMC